MHSKRLGTLGLALPLALALAMPMGAASVERAQDEVTSPEDSSLFLTGPSKADPEKIAVSFLQKAADSYGLDAADVSDLKVVSRYASSHNGVTHVNVQQFHQGLEVFGAFATVNVAADGSVISVGENLVSGLAAAAAARTATAGLDATAAVESAAKGLGLDRPQNLRVERRMATSSSQGQQTMVSGGGISDEAIPARLGWQPTENGLRQAWQVTIDDSSDVHLWNATVDAATGKLLESQDWTSDDSHEDLEATLSRSHQGAVSASGGAAAGTSAAGAATSGATAGAKAGSGLSPDSVEDGSSYRVLEFPMESPNDGDRVLVTNPADSVGSPFGWHDTDGTPGPEYTITRGNNAHAYTDQDGDGVPDPDGQPDGGPGLDFDFPLDLGEHAQTYRDAAVTNLFYANNVIHDVLYRYGFDEASGNFQVTNYTGEGNGGDDVRAEAADGRGTNNANFSTPAMDGGRPRMQMYLWPGAQFGGPNALTLGSGEDAVTYAGNYARFTPALSTEGFSGPVVLVDDGEGTTSDGCTTYSLPAGSIALLDTSDDCNAYTQVVNAEEAGAVAVVIVADDDRAPILSGSMDPAVGIPAMSVTDTDGAAIKETVADGATQGRVHKNPAHPAIRDGDLENGIIIHEYGHGVSNRLTGGPTVNCLGGDEQMGEGWSDFLAITMLLDPELDNPEGMRGMGPYALYQPNRGGGGIRPAPYSRTMDIQPFTYDRIQTGGWTNGGSLARPHGIGHAWAATLWDMTWDLIDRHGFNEDIYGAWNTGGNNRALQYVIDGMKMQGCAPGFIAGRDGILAADAALGGEDNCLIWSSFARRGLGYSAVQGTTDRDDNTEAFDVPSWCAAPGEGVVGPRFGNAPELNEVNAGSTAPIFFNLDGDRGLDILKPSQAPASQQIDCTTLEPLQYATTTPTTHGPGRDRLKYNERQDRYHYNWRTQEDWEGTCRQLIITLEDGTQHRANFRFS